VPVGLLHDLLGVQLSAGSIASVVSTCHQHLAQGENELKATLVKAAVLQKARNGHAGRQRGLVGSRLFNGSTHA
jgi:hypothetical protein